MIDIQKAQKGEKNMSYIEGLDLEYGVSEPSPLLALNQDSTSAEEKDRIQRIKQAAATISNSDLSLNNLKPIQVTPVDDTATVQKTTQSLRRSFPNVARMMMDVGLKIERQKNQEIKGNIAEASEIQKTIGRLIDANSKFAHLIDPNNEKEVALGKDLQELCDHLKNKGIDIIGDSKGPVSQQRIAEIKANVSAHMDRLKTELQTVFTTKIQVKIQEVQSILECLKTIEKYSNRLVSNIVDKYAK